MRFFFVNPCADRTRYRRVDTTIFFKKEEISLFFLPQIFIFVVSFGRSFVNLVGLAPEGCGFPWQMDLLSVLMFSLMFVLFAEFYVQVISNIRIEKSSQPFSRS